MYLTYWLCARRVTQYSICSVAACWSRQSCSGLCWHSPSSFLSHWLPSREIPRNSKPSCRTARGVFGWEADRAPPFSMDPAFSRFSISLPGLGPIRTPCPIICRRRRAWLHLQDHSQLRSVQRGRDEPLWRIGLRFGGQSIRYDQQRGQFHVSVHHEPGLWCGD